MRYQAALRPDLRGWHLGSVADNTRRWPSDHDAEDKKLPVVAPALCGVMVVPALYLLAALVGSLVPVNRGWTEPDDGITVYLANNGVHADIVMPVKAEGLDWTPFVPKSDFAAADPGARWVAFGAGEKRVYLNTPTW